MRIKHYYCLDEKYGIAKFLNTNNIPYEITKFNEIGFSRCTFFLYEDQDEYIKFRRRFFWITEYNSIKSVEYSKEEMENAQWFAVRNISAMVHLEYDDSAFENSCPYKRLFVKEPYYKHSEQIDYLSAYKVVKWGKRHYFSGPDTADDILFCSEKAKIALGCKWTGLEFWPVKKYNNTGYMENLYQLYFSETLPLEAIVCDKKTTCCTCGKILAVHDIRKQISIKKEYFNNPLAVYKTGSVFTNDIRGRESFSFNIVNKEFYLYCEKHDMNRGMVYEPILLM